MLIAAALTVALASPIAGPRAAAPLAADGTGLWVVNEDHASVSRVDLATLTFHAEIPVGARPRAVAVVEGGAVVSVDGLAGLVRIGPELAVVATAGDICRGAHGIVPLAEGRQVLVACQDDDRLLLVDAATLAVRAAIPVDDGPRAIAIDAAGRIAYVSHFLSRGAAGRVSRIALDRDPPQVIRVIELVAGADPGDTGVPVSVPVRVSSGVPNLLGTLAIDPSGRVWVGGLVSNSATAVRPSPARPSCAPQAPTQLVRGLLAVIDPSSHSERSDLRIDPGATDAVNGIGFLADGRHLSAVHPGTGELSVFDASPVAAPVGTRLTARIPIGEVPRGLVIVGDRGYTVGVLDRQLHVVDLRDPTAPELIASVSLTAEERMLPEVLRGKRLFYRSSAPRHSRGGQVACASCHPDGGSDGRTWDFTGRGEGLRNTIDLRGRGGTAHGPLHWSGNFDEVQDFEGDIVHCFGGTGLLDDGRPPEPPLGPPNAGRSADLDALAAFVRAAGRARPSPHRNTAGQLTAAAERGREVFYRASTRCAGCHVPPRFTLSALPPDPLALRRFDVGTLGPGSGQRAFAALDGLDVPSLLGVWDGAPYLHRGQAPTLAAVLTGYNRQDRHGVTSSLTATERSDLEQFLLSIDGSPDELPPGDWPPAEVSPIGAPIPLLLTKEDRGIRFVWGYTPGASSYRLARGQIGQWRTHRVDPSQDAGRGPIDPAQHTTIDLDDAVVRGSFYYRVSARGPEGAAGTAAPSR